MVTTCTVATCEVAAFVWWLFLCNEYALVGLFCDGHFSGGYFFGGPFCGVGTFVLGNLHICFLVDISAFMIYSPFHFVFQGGSTQVLASRIPGGIKRDKGCL